MDKIINAAIGRSRAVILVFLLILISGTSAYINIPKESDPDVKIPLIYVSMSHEGISPEDAERLLIRPMEKELRGIEGVKEVVGIGNQGSASIKIEFFAGLDSNKALTDVRDKVDLVKPDLPDDTDEPIITEINLSLFPVINVILTSNIPERSFLKIARRLRDRIEEISSVLNVEIAGDREEAVEIVIKPEMLESYNLTSSLIDFVARNNLLIAAGDMDAEQAGKYVVKVPGLLENINDIINLPIKVSGDSIVTVGDIATIKKSYKDVSGFARVNGKPALVLEVSKRIGENVIETIEQVKTIVLEDSQLWPEGINISYAQDSSDRIKDMLSDLQNNVIFATLLVLIVIIAFIGIKSAGLIAIAIPGAFLIGILVLSFLGLTMNIVVLFALILSIGMLVDSAIIVVEYANRKMIDGMSYKLAYGEAARRMAWPIIASTITTLLVFAPLLFWPGIMGQFMKYLPLTLMATLSGSLLMALIFIPTLGSWLGKIKKFDSKTIYRIKAGETGNLDDIGGLTGRYVSTLNHVLNFPIKFIFIIMSMLVVLFYVYFGFIAKTEFFPTVEPDNARVIVRARGNLSTIEKDNIVKEVESYIYDMRDEVKVIYSRSGHMGGQSNELAEDVIGIIMLEFQDWNERRKADDILADIKSKTEHLAGIIIEARKEKGGPSTGRPISLEIASKFPELIEPVAIKILNFMNSMEGVSDIEDSRPVPAIEWKIDVDRSIAARFGVDLAIIGNFVKLVTNGMKITTYRPDDNDNEIDILLRFPAEDRGLAQLDRLRAITSSGAIPISNFVERKAQPKIGKIMRVDGARVITIKADVEAGILVSDKLKEMQEEFKKIYKAGEIDPRVQLRFKGEDKDQKETMNFLASAFILALFGMTLVLLVQFNSIYYTFIIMSAVFLSTAGVVAGLIITAQPFGIVMCGVGTIALSGIVVNNNIIFIDTYKSLCNMGMDKREALLRTGAQRLRPILLTAGTTVLGLIPMVTAMNINFFTREITFGAPSTQWWQQLSTSIAGGLTFATILTLFLTPCLIYIGERKNNTTQ